MEMSPGRRFAEGVGSWLHLEFCCFRAGLLSENSLKSVVGNIMSTFPISEKGIRAYSDFPHMALNRNYKGGRPKSVDFALTLHGDGIDKKNVLIAIESKWCGSKHCTPSKISQDFIRLALIKREDPAARCIFLLAGNAKNLMLQLNKMPFNSGEAQIGCIGYAGGERKLKFNPSLKKHKINFASAIQLYQNIPSEIIVKSFPLHPLQTTSGTVKFQAITWEVTKVSKNNVVRSDWET